MNSNINKSDLQKIERDLNQMLIKLLLKLNLENDDLENKDELIKQINLLSKSVPQLIKLSDRISSELNHHSQIEEKYNKIIENEKMLEKAIEIINFLN